MAFVYVCQMVLVAPLSVASGAVGFANYLQYYWHGMTPLEHNATAAMVCVAVTVLLYRDTATVARLAIGMLVIVLGTVGWVIGAGAAESSLRLAFTFPPEAFQLNRDLVVRVGAASVLAMYSYGGYNQVCSIGEEIRNPEKNVPRSIILSIAVVAVLYVAMSSAIVGLIPWREAARSETIASLFIERTIAQPLAARLGAITMTALILFVAAASLFSLILGYSRVLFAASRDGDFFHVFARVHATKQFPHVALATIGLVSLPFCFFSMDQLVNWLMQVQILTIAVWQCAGVLLLHRYRKDLPQPFRMWIYPIPALVALVMWVYVYASGPTAGITFSVGFLLASVLLYAVFARTSRRLA